MQHSLHRRQVSSVHGSSQRIHRHSLVQPRRSVTNVQHNPSSQQQQLPRAVAAAAQPDRSGHTFDDQHIASGHEALQAYAELQQQAGQQDDSSLPQQLAVQASGKLPNQADQLWGDPSDRESREVALVEPATRSYADLDYLSVGGSCRVTLPARTGSRLSHKPTGKKQDAAMHMFSLAGLIVTQSGRMEGFLAVVGLVAVAASLCRARNTSSSSAGSKPPNPPSRHAQPVETRQTTYQICCLWTYASPLFDCCIHCRSC